MCTVRSVSVVSEASISGSGPTGNALAHEIAHSLGGYRMMEIAVLLGIIVLMLDF